MKAVQPQAHEFDVQFNFTQWGLDGYFAADSVVKAHDGAHAGNFQPFGDDWVARLSYQDSNILHPGEETPTGTPFEIQTVREFRLKVEAQDETGEKKFTAHIRPCWKNMRAERNDGSTVSIPLPGGLEEGVNARAQGSNIEFGNYLRLLQFGAEAVGLNSRYFENPHESSNIQDAARYSRVHTKDSGPIHARDGPIWALGHLLEDDRSGFRKIVQNDDTNGGMNRPGYYHTVTLGPRRVQEAWPDHTLPKEIKHYYARDPQDRDPKNDPLAHPKLEASYQSSRSDETLYYSEENLEKLNRELDEAVRSVLQDAELDISPSGESGPYVQDAYFEAQLVETEQPTAIDITQVKQEQEHIVVKHLSDGISPAEEEALETLVADGGQISPQDIAEENDRHLWSVYRALRRIDGLVERKYGEVALRSEFVAEKVWNALQEARDGLDRAYLGWGRPEPPRRPTA